MQFMITWTLYTETFDEALTYFSQMTAEDDREQLGDNVTMVGRWNDLVSGTGVAILESDDLSAVNDFCLNWTNVCELKITPVLDDEKVRAIWRAREPVRKMATSPQSPLRGIQRTSPRRSARAV